MRLAAVLALAGVVAAVAASARATTITSTIVQVNVSLRTSSVALSPSSAPRGYTVEFGVRNRTAAARTFSLAGRRIRVPARALRYLGFEFDRRGTYRYTSGGAGRVVRGTFLVS